MCGLAGADPAAGEAAAAEIEKCRAALAGGGGQPLAELARQILERLPRGIGFNALTALVSRLAGIRDAPESAGATGENPAESVADPAPAAAERLELREHVALLWREIRELPERQRAALLLHLRTTHGAALWLIADLGVARFGELADCLAMEDGKLAEIRNRLPLEDAEIAGRLGLARQQIVNLRQAARQRLARRTSTGRSAPMRPGNRS